MLVAEKTKVQVPDSAGYFYPHAFNIELAVRVIGNANLKKELRKLSDLQPVAILARRNPKRRRIIGVTCLCGFQCPAISLKTGESPGR
jgi:hypothetical protein